MSINKAYIPLIIGTLFLAGCGVPGMQEKELPMNEETFNTLASNNIEAWNSEFSEYLPSKEALLKGESKLSIAINADMTPSLGAGKVEANIVLEGKKDISNKNDPKGTAKLDITMDSNGLPITVNADIKAEARVVENSIFASLQKMDINIPFVPLPSSEMVKPILGKWYGDTFATLSSYTNGEMDIQKFIASKGLMLSMMEMMEELKNDPTKTYTFIKALPERSTGDIKYFEVKANSEYSLQVIDTIFSSFGLSGVQMEQTKAEMKKTIEEQSDKTMVVGFNPKNGKDFYAEMPAIDMQTQEIIEGSINTMVMTEEKIMYDIIISKEEEMKFLAENNLFSVTLVKGEESMTPITGTYKENEFTFTLHEVNEEIVKGEFKKSGNSWNGEINSLQADKTKVLVKGLEYSKGNFEGNLEILAPVTPDGDAISLATIIVKYTISELENITVEKPENAEPFMNIQSALEAPTPTTIPVEADGGIGAGAEPIEEELELEIIDIPVSE